MNLELPLDWPAGADPLFVGAKEWARAHEAICARLPESLEALLEAGFPVNAEDEESKRTLLHTAAGWGNAAMVCMLLKRGATIDKPDVGGEMPLHWAAWNNREDTVRALCEAGANLNARTDYDETPLHTAARRLAPKAVKALIDAGADADSPSDQGSPLFITVTAGNDTRWESDYHRNGGMRADVRVLRALLDAGAEPSEAVLAEAVASNHTLAIRALVRAGADPTTVEPGRHADARQALAELIAKREAGVLRTVLRNVAEPVAVRERSRL
ncbi:TPA: ankyrin repeat domain-containing protein [Burkholderia vietnamiensis]|nr:ankyrin repeat domain-containing protein [Burkholderia vietnamiensis]HDR9168677.1 ankyrin repeat domain-containing protein [Burkholderia vietnamiensis]